MPKGYWIACYMSISDPEAFAEYAKLAGPALKAGGGRFLARGLPTKTLEGGIMERVVVIEFESVGQAIAAYQSAAYGEARKVLGDSVKRDIRIVEGAS